jgi:mRNA interferase RelE/StbE
MAAYRIEFSPHARREFSSLSKTIQKRIDEKILTLTLNPRPSGVKKLKGFENRWRIRVGDYRIIYEIIDNRLIVLVVQIAHRKDAYS